ncbi:MAG: BON domain-containing protein [Actinomycetota bacterium]
MATLGDRERSDYASFGRWAALKPSDGEIRGILVDQLREDPFTRRESIHVTVSEGVVTLTGSVTSSTARRAADDDAWSTPGVRDVENHLRVTLRRSHDGPRAA